MGNTKSICRGIGAVALATLFFASAAGVLAKVNVRVDLGRHPGASIHYGGRPVVRPVVPPHVVLPPHYDPPALVRHEHYEVHGYRGPWRFPYGDEYVRHFRPGWRPIVVDGAQYYTYPVLPLGFATVVVNGVTYYLFDGVYYLPYIYEGQTVYMVVPPPVPG